MKKYFSQNLNGFWLTLSTLCVLLPFTLSKHPHRWGYADHPTDPLCQGFSGVSCGTTSAYDGCVAISLYPPYQTLAQRFHFACARMSPVQLLQHLQVKHSWYNGALSSKDAAPLRWVFVWLPPERTWISDTLPEHSAPYNFQSSGFCHVADATVLLVRGKLYIYCSWSISASSVLSHSTRSLLLTGSVDSALAFLASSCADIWCSNGNTIKRHIVLHSHYWECWNFSVLCEDEYKQSVCCQLPAQSIVRTGTQRTSILHTISRASLSIWLYFSSVLDSICDAEVISDLMSLR